MEELGDCASVLEPFFGTKEDARSLKTDSMLWGEVNTMVDSWEDGKKEDLSDRQLVLEEETLFKDDEEPTAFSRPVSDDGDSLQRHAESTTRAHEEEKERYRDHSDDIISHEANNVEYKKGADPFPVILHTLLHELEISGRESIASWQPHGRAFAVHNVRAFEKQVISCYFNQSNISSFQRQLRKYGFICLEQPGQDKGAYYHEYFLRGREDLCVNITRGRKASQWTKIRHKGWAKLEPDLSAMTSI